MDGVAGNQERTPTPRPAENRPDFLQRVATATTGRRDKDTFLALQAIAADFEGLIDVSALAAQAAELGRDKNIQDALKKDREEDGREDG